MSADATTTGKIEDVAAFFRVSVRTVQNWYLAPKPLLTFWNEGRNLSFGEEAVIELRARFLRLSRPFEPGEAEEMARREWREHLGVRRQMADGRDQITELRARVERLEARQSDLALDSAA